MVSMLYRIARAAAWGRAIGKLASGNPKPLLRRTRNRLLYARILSRLFRM